MAEVENMVEDVEDLLVDIKESMTRLSRVCDGLKALKFMPCVENIQQIPPAVLCEPKRSYNADAAYYHYSASLIQNSQNTKFLETNVVKNSLTSYQFSGIENTKEKTLPVASVTCEPKPKYHAASSVVETSKINDDEDLPQNCSSTREIMMMVEGKELNIIKVRPKLIKKQC